VPDRIAPNQYSPYADAHPDVRHLIEALPFASQPKPGVLAPVACGGMAVVPPEPLRVAATGELPAGLCTACVRVAFYGGAPDPPERATCRECGGGSSHGDLCALCRQDLHEEWWPTRDAHQGADTRA
jgi:hypothetical protein